MGKIWDPQRKKIEGYEFTRQCHWLKKKRKHKKGKSTAMKKMY